MLDSDDFFKKNKLSSIVKDFQKNKELSFIQDTPIFKNFEKAYTSKRKLNLFSIWPRFYPTSTIAVNRKFFKNFIKISQKKKFPNLEIDARISIYAYLKNKFRVSKNKLTIYNNQTNGISSKYNKFSRNWWKKRLEAYKYTFEIMKNLKIKIKKTPDYYLTKFINLII